MGQRVLIGLIVLGCDEPSPPREIVEAAPAPRTVPAPGPRKPLTIGAEAKAFVTIRPPWKIADAQGVVLDGVSAAFRASRRSAYSVGPALFVEASLRLDTPPAQSSSVWVKASCRSEDRVLVAVDEVGDDDWLLYQIRDEQIGQDLAVHQELFGNVDVDVTQPCQLEFRLVPVQKGPMYRIQPRYCVTDEGVSAGECPGLVHAPRGDDPRHEVTGWELDGTRVSFFVTAGERFSRYHRVAVRSECPDGMQMASAITRWQWLDPGESRRMSVSLARVGDCSLTVERWRQESDASPITDHVALGRACIDAGTLAAGACSDAKPAPSPKPGPGPAFSVTLRSASLYASTGWSSLHLAVDLEAVRLPSGTGELSGNLECTTPDGTKTAAMSASGFDPRLMRVGDEALRTFRGYVDDNASRCEVTVSEGEQELGRWCVEEAGEVDCGP